MPPSTAFQSLPLQRLAEVRVLTTHLCIQKHSGATFGYTLNILYFNCHLEDAPQSIRDFINTGNVRVTLRALLFPHKAAGWRVLAQAQGDNVHRSRNAGAVGTAPNCTAASNSVQNTCTH